MSSVPTSTRTAQGRIGHCHAAAESLIECLVRQFELAAKDAEWLVSFGAVYVDRQRVTADQTLSPGQYVRVHLDPKRFPVDGIDWRGTIVHDTKEFIVVNKPAGIPVHPTVDNAVENVGTRLSTTIGPVYVTQRLDADVSGLVVFARTQQYLQEFNRLLRERKVRKRYRALVASAPPPGTHVHYMEPSKRSPKHVSPEDHPGWLQCVLHVVDVRTVGNLFTVGIDLETGRTHQIRAQLAALGAPIVGDRLYGSNVGYESTGIGLVSASVSWTAADGKEWSFQVSRIPLLS